jgi:hypothetical protein
MTNTSNKMYAACKFLNVLLGKVFETLQMIINYIKKKKAYLENHDLTLG